MEISYVDTTNTVPHESKSFTAEVKRLYENPILNRLLKPIKDSSRNSQIQELQETKDKLEKELNEAKTAYFASCQKVNESKEESERLQNQINEFLNHDQIISRKKAELEKEFVLLQKTKVNSHDEELLEKTKFQYKCMRNITQIRFSYDKLDEDILQGYVFNKVTQKITSFSINVSKFDNAQIQEQLMKLMKNASHPSYANVPVE